MSSDKHNDEFKCLFCSGLLQLLLFCFSDDAADLLSVAAECSVPASFSVVFATAILSSSCNEEDLL
jgi:hypothetical protein